MQYLTEEDLDHFHYYQEAVVDGIIQLRERCGLEQEWVAEKAGYSVEQYLKIENGERKVTMRDSMRLVLVMVEYEESLQPPLKRKLMKLNRRLGVEMEMLQIYLEESVPGIDQVFRNTSLNTYIKQFLCGFAIIIFLIFGPSAYEFGFFLGRFYRLVTLGSY